MFFVFSLYEIVDSKNNPDNYRTLKITIGTIIKHPEMLRFVPVCKTAVKKFPFVIKYGSDQYKTKEMCDKVIIENCGMLGFIPDCYKIKNVWYSCW